LAPLSIAAILKYGETWQAASVVVATWVVVAAAVTTVEVTIDELDELDELEELELDELEEE